jgi:hypothetical protein
MTNSTDSYRSNAEECLRLAGLDRNEHDRPLWVTLAQSWLRLAEHADRLNDDVKSGGLAPDEEPEREVDETLARD